MKVLKYPIIPFTLCIAAGIFTGCSYLPPLYIILIIILLAFSGMLVAHRQAHKSLLPKPFFEISLTALGFAMGLLSQWIYFSPNTPSHYTNLISQKETPIFYGVISERLKPNNFYEKYLFEIKAVNKCPASGTLLITLPKDSLKTRLQPGLNLFINAKPTTVAPPSPYYQFNYRKYMERKNIFHKIRLKNNYVLAGNDSGFYPYIYNLRNTLTESFNPLHLPAETQNLVNALVFGQRQDVDTDTTNNYTNAGVVHILAISGLHFALLFSILNGLLSPLKRLKHSGNILYLITILALIWLFACITGLSASVVRSAVMFSFLILGGAINRRVSIYNSLAVSAMILLLIKPAFLFDAGFQLSYMAVLGIVVLQPFYKKQLKSKYRIINALRDLIMVSITAQIAVLPLTLYYFHQFPLLFLIANIIVIPLSNVVLILAMITLLFNFCWQWGAFNIAKPLQWSIEIMNTFTEWIASFNNLVLKNIPFNIALLFFLYSALLVSTLYLYQKSFKKAVVVFISILAFQLTFIISKNNAHAKNEFIVFQNFNHTIISQKEQKKTTVYSTDTAALHKPGVIAYSCSNFNSPLKLQPLPHFLFFHQKKILVIDSTGVYIPELQPDILIITGSPQVNFDRLLQHLKPTQVIADATNFKTYVARWEKSCHKQKIPFHATAEKGSFVLE